MGPVESGCNTNDTQVILSEFAHDDHRQLRHGQEEGYQPTNSCSLQRPITAIWFDSFVSGSQQTCPFFDNCTFSCLKSMTLQHDSLKVWDVSTSEILAGKCH